MNKVTAVVLTLIILAFGVGVFFTVSQKAEKVIDFSLYDSTKPIPADENNGGIDEHVRGAADSKVVVVEYADLQCPGCAGVMPRISELTKEYGDRVAFVFRSFPLNGHQNARAASAAIESAGFQGYFWEMVETLYANRGDWINENGNARTDVFARLFKEVAPDGDESKFRLDLSDERITKKINFDYGMGINVDKVTATPAFYVNGKTTDFTKAESQDDIRSMLEELINEALAEYDLPTGGHYDFLNNIDSAEMEVTPVE